MGSQKGEIAVVEFQGNGGYRAFGPIKGTWKSEGLVDPEQLGRWRSRGQEEKGQRGDSVLGLRGSIRIQEVLGLERGVEDTQGLRV